MSKPLVDLLAWTLIHFLWQGAAVAGTLWIAARMLSKQSANARYAAAGLALALLAICPVVTLIVLAPHGSGLPASAATVHGPLAAPPAVTVVLAEPSSASEPILERWLPTFVAIWAIGVALLSIRLLGGLFLVERLKRRFCLAAPAGLQERLDWLAAKMGIRRRVTLAVSHRVAAPSTVGVFRAFVILPASFFAKLSPEQIEVVLAHELAHVARHDYFVNLLQSVLEVVLFYHPAVWWVSHVARLEREHCCDDAAIRVTGSPVLYAETLALLEERRRLPSLKLSATGGSLMNRIRRILGLSAAPIRPSAACAAAIVLLGLVVLVGSALPARATNPQDRPLPKAKPGNTLPKTEAKVVVVGKGGVPLPVMAATDGPPTGEDRPEGPALPPAAGKPSRDYELSSASAEEFLAAIDSGALSFPEGVTVTMTEERNRLPRLSIGGDAKVVEHAVAIISSWDRAPAQILVKCEVSENNRVVSAPIIRTFAGKPATCSVSASEGGAADVQVRACPIVQKDGSVSLRVTISVFRVRLVIPFLLASEEELTIVAGSDGNPVLQATNLRSRAMRSVSVPIDFGALIGTHFKFSASAADPGPDLKARASDVPAPVAPNDDREEGPGCRLIKGKFTDLVPYVTEHLNIYAVVAPGNYPYVEVPIKLYRDPGKLPDIAGTMQRFCKAGHAVYEVRGGTYYIKPGPK